LYEAIDIFLSTFTTLPLGRSFDSKKKIPATFYEARATGVNLLKENSQSTNYGLAGNFALK